jgi:carbon-monoxide dehydrogenase medium subunit
MAVGGVGPAPIRVPKAEALLRGEAPNTEAFQAAGDCAARAADPVDDLYGSVEYKRHLVGLMTVKALHKAAERAKATSNGH